MTMKTLNHNEDPLHRLKSSLLRSMIRESVVITVLLVNTAVFVLLAVDPTVIDRVGHWITFVDTGCIIYFVFEAVVKLWALGFRGYFSSRWNQFDFVIVLASVPALLAPLLNLPAHMMSGILVLRFARFLRVLRMVRYAFILPSIKPLRLPILGIIILVTCQSLLLDNPDLMARLPVSFALWLPKGYAFLIVMVAFWLLAKLYDIFDALTLRPMTLGPDPKLDGLLLSFFNVLINITCFAVGFILAIRNAGYDPWTIIAGIGLGGMAVAFAAQDTIANVLSGVFLFLQRPFKIGERIEISGAEGKVQQIGLRTVTIRRTNGEVLSIPNKNFTSNVFKNIDQRTNYMTCLSIPIDSNTHPDKVEEAISLLTDIAKNAPILDRPYYVHFNKIPGNGSFILDLWIRTKKWHPDEKDVFPDDNTKMYMGPTLIHTQIVRRFSEAGIAFAKIPVAFAAQTGVPEKAGA
ncbi:MAG: mechanosensitive ion channel [Magnetococcales bacterium]|nr:mechanosensitive ion channel [Magnetococcales bacterium]